MTDNTFVNFAFYMGFPDLIRVTSSAENIDLARKRKLVVLRSHCRNYGEHKGLAVLNSELSKLSL